MDKYLEISYLEKYNSDIKTIYIFEISVQFQFDFMYHMIFSNNLNFFGFRFQNRISQKNEGKIFKF